MDDDKKWEIVLNLLTVVPAIVRGIPEAVKVYERMLAALKDGVSDEEWQAALAERDLAIQAVIAKAEG